MTKVNLILLKGFFVFMVIFIGGLFHDLVMAESTPPACKNWSAPQKITEFSGRELQEISGMALSQKVPKRIFFHNDSGDGPYFYISQIESSGIQKVQKINIRSFKPKDVEDMAVAKCFNNENESCVYLADIGDNKKERSSIQIAIIKEVENFPSSVTPLHIITLKYPDGPHNAEGFSIDPLTGNIVIITKESSSVPAKIYEVNREKISQSSTYLTYKRSIDLPSILKGEPVWAQIVTSFDISPEGGHYLILTYNRAIEITADLRDFSVIPIKRLTQQEAISYAHSVGSSRFFYYTTEIKESSLNNPPLMKVECLD